jgi:hypothetical protein
MASQDATLAPKPEQIERFLQCLHGGKPDALWSYTWHLPNKDSGWFTTLGDMLHATIQRAQQPNTTAIYTGVAWGVKAYGAHQRIKAKEAAGIPALWSDIDIAGPGHKKPNLPPSFMSAMEFLDEYAPEPSLLVWSGHGIQAWWLFKEPWLFESEEDRADGMKLALDWNNYIRHAAKAVGWDVDAVHDLARVMRVPGTINAKEGEAPVLSELRSDSMEQYEHIAFTQRMQSYYSAEASATVASASKFLVQKRSDVRSANGALAIRADAVPPFRKWEALLEVEPKARLSWEHRRKDLQDQSASSFDLSLAIFAVRASWHDQEIVDLLVAHRLKYNEDLKRPDYYERTIAKARSLVNDAEAKEGIAEIVIDEERGAHDPEVRKRALDTLSVRFKVKIVRIIKFAEDPARYVLETERGYAEIGDISKLMNPASMRHVIASKLNHIIPRFKKGDEWEDICKVIMLALEEWEGDAEATTEGRAWSWIDSYLARRPPTTDTSDAAREYAPFEKDGNVYIFGSELRRHLTATRDERVTSKAMGQALRLIGCVAEQINVHVGGRQVCRQVWRLPPSSRDDP